VTDARAGAHERLAALSERIEGFLATALPPAREGGSRPFGEDRLLESMSYSLRAPGKRLRPLLALGAAETAGVRAEPLVPFASAIEMIHAYSLVHDDLPAMDDDDLRRGLPTNHVVFGEGMAILAGDGLLTEAFVLMLAPVVIEGRMVDPSVQMRVIADVARAAGCMGMVGGQAADLLAENTRPEPEVVRAIHLRKTGAIIRAAVGAGAALAGARRDLADALGAFAERFGLAFQIADDIKDELASPRDTGKRRGGDRASGKVTYPALYGIERSREICRAELEAAIDLLSVFREQAMLLEAIARDSVLPAVAAAGV
jgi:geranylgeranyl diphosphate synthase type II